MNRVFILGNLGQDPETKYTQSGAMVLNMSVATNEGTKDKPVTNWHRVVCFGKLAEACSKALGKGSRVLVEGRINYREWEKDGERHKVTEIVAFQVHFLDPPKKREGEQRGESGPEISDEDIPF